MVVPVALVGGVPVTVVQVVDMPVVRNRHMATALAVLVLMSAVHLVAGLSALVHVVGMSAVNVAVMGVVGVVTVLERDVTTALAVLVRVVGMGAVVRSGGHLRLLTS